MNINAVGVKLEIIVEPQKCESIIQGGIFWYKEVCCEKMTWILAPDEESLCIIKLHHYQPNQNAYFYNPIYVFLLTLISQQLTNYFLGLTPYLTVDKIFPQYVSEIVSHRSN